MLRNGVGDLVDCGWEPGFVDDEDWIVSDGAGAFLPEEEPVLDVVWVPDILCQWCVDDVWW